MNWDALIWLILLVVFVYVEASTVTLVSTWFAFGALAALLASIFGGTLTLQIILFFAVSIVLLAALRPIFRKFIKPGIVKTNVDALIGAEALITETVDNLAGMGKVKIAAMEWTARSTDGSILAVGARVRVDKIEGVKVFVSTAE